MMHSCDARQQFIEGLERYVSGIETDEGLARLAENVSANHDRIPYEACGLVCAVVWPRRRFTASYAGAMSDLLAQVATLREADELDN